MPKPLPEPPIDRPATDKKPVQPAPTAVINTIEYAGSVAQKKHLTAPPPSLHSQFTVVANRYYFKERPDQEAFVDHGARLRTRHNQSPVAKAMLDLAESRGWDTIQVNGQTEFKQAVWLEASLKGIQVTGYTPTSADQAALRTRQPAPGPATLRPAESPAPAPTAGPAPAPVVSPAPAPTARPVPVVSPASAPTAGPAPAPTVSSAPAPTASPAPARGAAAWYAARREQFKATTQHAAQQRESRQAAVRDQVMQQDRAQRQVQEAQVRAEQQQQAAQQEKAVQLRAAVDTLDKRSAMQQYPELARLYPLLAEAENFAKAHLRPENHAEFVEQIKVRSLQELARGETLPKLPTVAAKASSQDRRQERAAEVER